MGLYGPGNTPAPWADLEGPTYEAFLKAMALTRPREREDAAAYLERGRQIAEKVRGSSRQTSHHPQGTDLA